MNDEKVMIDLLDKDVLLWTFDPHASFDQPFHALIAQYGIEAVMALDALVLDGTRDAARNAVKFYREKLIDKGVDDAVIREQSMSLAQAIGEALKNQQIAVSHEPLLPETAIFQPIVRPTM